MSDDYEALPDHIPFSNHLVAGAMAGIMEHSLMYPIDNIKTRIQAAIHHTASTKSNNSLVASIKHISSSEGLKSLWKGISAVIIGAGPAHAVYFGVYEFFKNNLIDNHNHNSTNKFDSLLYYGKIALAGSIATASSEALMNPFDTIKQRMQINSSLKANCRLFNPSYNSIWSTMSYIFKKEGFRSFYYSYPTTLLMTIPFHSTNFLVYESMTSFLNPDNHYNPLVHCVSGGLAGGLASAITTPFDCIKTVLQTHNFTKNLESNEIIIQEPIKKNQPPGIAGGNNKDSPSSSSSKIPTNNSKLNMASPRSFHTLLKVSHFEDFSILNSSGNSSKNNASVDSFLSAAKHVYNRHGGLIGFSKGLKARVISNIPATAILWTSYEMAKFYLNKKYIQDEIASRALK